MITHLIGTDQSWGVGKVFDMWRRGWEVGSGRFVYFCLGCVFF